MAIAHLITYSLSLTSRVGKHLAETLGVIAELGSESAEALRDQSCWEPAKRLAMQILPEGVDSTDETAVQDWLSARMDQYSRCLTAS